MGQHKTTDDLLDHALQLATLAESAAELPFRLELRRGRLVLEVRVWESAAPSGEPGPTPPADLPAIERAVYAVLTREYKPPKVIAGLAGRSLSYVRAALRSLRGKGLAEHLSPAGWRRKEVAVGG